MSSLGRKIWELRKERGLTQNELGDRIQVDGRQISRYENGRVKPSKKVIGRLCDFFGVSPDALLSEKATSDPVAEISDPELYHQFLALDKLETKEKEALKVVIGAVLAKNRVQSLLLQEAS